MKKLVLIGILLLLFSGCKESDKIEVIKNYESEFKDVSIQKVFYNGGQPILNIDNTGHQQILVEDTTRNESSYRIYVNEKGEIVRIQILHEGFTDVDKKNIEIIKSWQLEPIKQNEKIVKARFDFKIKYDDYFSETYSVAVEQMPSPIGGIGAIQKNIVYPENAKRAGIEGRVFVKAYIDKTGSVAKAEIIRGIGAGCDEAALEAVRKVKFTPGIDNGKHVNVQVTVPILFKLQ